MKSESAHGMQLVDRLVGRATAIDRATAIRRRGSLFVQETESVRRGGDTVVEYRYLAATNELRTGELHWLG